jgi:hypothetical protein
MKILNDPEHSSLESSFTKNVIQSEIRSMGDVITDIKQIPLRSNLIN